MGHPPTPCLLGVTASGKSGVAAELARRCGGEIIACDAFSIYRGMSILTAADDLPADVPHHLVAELDPRASWSAAAFVEACDERIETIRARGRRPWIVGGTALYLRSWLKGLGAAVARDVAFRDSLLRRVAEEGPESLYAQLRAADPERAAALHPNDVRRVVRALEIIRATGRKASELRREWDRPDRRPARLYGLRREGVDLEQRIEQRTHAMFEAGVVEEARALLETDLSREAASVLGLAELRDHLQGAISREEAERRIARRTRQLARKQRTFFNSFEAVVWVDVPPGATAEAVADRIQLAQETGATSP